MAHRNDVGRWLGAVTGVCIALALIAGQVSAGVHTHADAGDSPLSCAVCASSRHAPVVPAPLAPLTVTQTVLDVEPCVEPGTAPLRPAASPLRSRAPPVTL